VLPGSSQTEPQEINNEKLKNYIKRPQFEKRATYFEKKFKLYSLGRNEVVLCNIFAVAFDITVS
jgi:hypothetical protein